MNSNNVTCCYKYKARMLYCHDSCKVYKEQSEHHRQCVRSLYKEQQKKNRIAFATHRVDVTTWANINSYKVITT